MERHITGDFINLINIGLIKFRIALNTKDCPNVLFDLFKITDIFFSVVLLLKKMMGVFKCNFSLFNTLIFFLKDL